MAVKKKAAKKTAKKKVAAKKAVSKKVAAKKVSSKKTASKKTVSKKVSSKKVASKKTVSKKKVAKKKAAPARVKPIADKQTKLQVINEIAEKTGLTKAQVTAVFSTLGEMVEGHMRRRGSGEFTIPDTGVKIRKVVKPARKARMGRNPATGESIKIKAKPATTTVRISALKALKDVVNT